MRWFERSHARALLAAAALAALATGVTGCGDDDPAESASSTTEGPSSTSPSTSAIESSSTTTRATTSSEAPGTTTATSGTSATNASGGTSEQDVIDRYIAYWAARFEANSGTPNPDHPALPEYATGPQLDAVIAETRSNLDDGLAFQRAAEPRNFQEVTVVELDGDRAVVQECVVSDGVIVRRATGEVVNDDVATHNVRGQLTRVDGVWRLSEARLVQRWDGVAGCALES